MLAGLGVTFAACDDVAETESFPQSNPQLDMINTECVSVESAVTSTIDIASAPAQVVVARVVEGSEWPEDYTAEVPYVEISATEDFAEVRQLEAVTGDDGSVSVATDDIDAAKLNLIGKNPATITMHVRCAVNAVSDSQTVRMGGTSYFYGNLPIEIKPIDLFGGQVIEQEYYLVTSSDSWDITKAVKFEHSASDAYDDPSFSAVINVPAGGIQWAIIPASTYTAGSYGLNYGFDANGALVASENGITATPGEILSAGPHMISINMLDLTADQQLAIPYFHTPGQSNGWSHLASQKIPTRDYVNYCGYAYLDAIFKFSSGETWNEGLDLGYGGEGQLSTQGGDNNIPVDEPGLYYCTLNPIAMTYQLTKINAFGIIGDATPGGWDSDTALQPSDNGLVWTGTMALKSGELKFRANNGWDINLGGSSYEDLYQNEGNLQSPGEGTYLITLDLSSVPYSCSFAKQ